MKRLRLFTFRWAPAVGGAENHNRRMLQELGSRVDADVVTLANRNRTDWLKTLIDGDRDSAEVYEVDGRRVTALPRWPESVRRRLRMLAPAYHLPASPAPSMMGRALAPQLASFATGVDVVHNVFMGREAFSLAVMLAARRAGVPFVFTPLRHERPLGWNSPAFRTLYREADALIALTKREAAWLVSQGARPERIHVIGIGPMNDAAAKPDAAFEALGGKRRIVLFVGQLHTYKGFAAVAAAAQRLRGLGDVEFVFAGPDVRGHARELERAGPNVRWLGAVSDALRDSLLSACTVLCVPSSRESFGGVIVEAWWAGKPVIAGPAPAVGELVEDGVDGFVVPQDPAAIASRLEVLLSDESKAHDMGCRGQAKVSERFTWAQIASRHLDVYEQVAAERTPE